MNGPRVPQDEASRLCEEQLSRAYVLVSDGKGNPVRVVVDGPRVLFPEVVLCRIGVGSRYDLQTANLFGHGVERDHTLHTMLTSLVGRVLVDVQIFDSRCPVLFATRIRHPRPPAYHRVHAGEQLLVRLPNIFERLDDIRMTSNEPGCRVLASTVSWHEPHPAVALGLLFRPDRIFPCFRIIAFDSALQALKPIEDDRLSLVYILFR